MNITIRPVPFGFLVRIRKGVPPVFIRTPDIGCGDPRDGVISYISKMWELAR